MLSAKMIEALELAKRQEDGCINRYQLHHRTAYALMNRGLLKWTSGYGWKFGQLFELTEKGKLALQCDLCGDTGSATMGRHPSGPVKYASWKEDCPNGCKPLESE